MHKLQSPIPNILFNNSQLFFYGHRGLCGHKTENTLSSFIYALEKQMNGIELDVQRTADGEIIVFHDESLKKINGDKTPISQLNFSDIKNIKLKESASNQKNEYIPKLIDVINIIPKNVVLNIEIKSYKDKNYKIVSDINEIVDKYSLYENTIISSFNPFILNSIKKLNSNIPIALIWNGKTKFIKYCIRYLKPSAFHVNRNFINKQLVSWMHDRNVKVYTYTINTLEQLKIVTACKVDGIFTDIDLASQ